MESYTSEDARREWRRILNAVESGQQVEITRYGKPLAIVIPVESVHLYLLERKEKDINYDEMAGCVVAATSEAQARAAAADHAVDEGDGTWRDESRTSCTQLAAASEVRSGIVLRDFRGSAL